MIIIENLAKGMATFVIPVDLDGGELHHLGAQDRVSDPTTKTGSASLVVTPKVLPRSITLTAAGTEGCSGEYPDSYEVAPEIVAALKAKPPRLRLKKIPARVAAPAPVDVDQVSPTQEG